MTPCALAIALFVAAAGQPSTGDECQDCIIATDGFYAGTTADNSGGVDLTTCTDGDTIDEWYCYTPPETGLATAGLCGSSYDTAIAIFSECVAGEIACNDDLCGPPDQPPHQSGVTWGANGGQTYYIRISGFMNYTGPYLLYLHHTPIGQGSGDECWNSRTAYDGTTFGNTDQATGEFDDTTCTLNDIYDLWYLYTASCHGVVTADTCLTGFDTSLAMFSACDGVEIACNDDGCGFPQVGSRISWVADEGVVYMLRVAGFNEGQGPFYLRIACETCGHIAPGDFNGDSLANGADVQGFVAAILTSSDDPDALCAGDFDENGELSITDIPGFAEHLTQPPE
ncbi:MAG TPA: hypothetical protein VNT79_10100 [Phycisphaerae bacterium]|nr:hypothetical protein [Phycisphaerae bacterium]